MDFKIVGKKIIIATFLFLSFFLFLKKSELKFINLASASSDSETEVTLVITANKSPEKKESSQSKSKLVFISEKSYFVILWKGIKEKLTFFTNFF
jgi:hypothetical protein